MIREKLIDKGIGGEHKFRWRGNFGVFAGFTYMLCPIVLTIHGTLMGKRRRRIEDEFDLVRAGNSGP